MRAAPSAVVRPTLSPVRSRGTLSIRMEDRETNFLEDLWQRYVLIRPGMDMDELRNSTKLRTARSWSWEERTPGTARTIVITGFVITLFAIPLLLTNPTVLAYVLNLATLSREGVTPQDFFSVEEGRIFNPSFWTNEFPAVLVASFGQLARLFADLVEWVFRERPAW